MTKRANHNYERALEQTVSDEQFNSQAMQELAETLQDDALIKAEHDKTVEDILLDTIAEPDPIEHSSGETAQLTDRKFSYKQEAEDSLNDKHVEGRYRIIGDLGTGATGHVFSVHDNNFNRDIAVKFLHPKYASDQRKMLQFLNEARITSKLTHPNILPIHDIDFTEGALIYFTMGKADGSSLADLLRDEKQKPNPTSPVHHFNDRVRILQQICHAISYAHSQGIVHKDIKPSNIMVGNFGEVLVVDWGTASYDDEDNKKKTLVGTPIYMSPEQARKECADSLSDIYCIGSTFLHMLTLEYPCMADDLDTFWEQKRMGAYNEPSAEIRKRIPKQLYTIALKAMSAQRNERYQDVDEIIQDLEAYQHGRSISAYTESLGEIFTRLIKHNKLTASLALVGLLIIGLASLWLYNEKVHIYRSWETVSSAPHKPITYSSWILSDASGSHIESETPSPLYATIQNTLRIQTSPTAEPLNLRYHKSIADIMRIAWTHKPSNAAQSVHFFIAGSTCKNGYSFKFSSIKDDCMLSFSKQGQLFSQSKIPMPSTSDFYHLSVIKDDSHIAVSIDNTVVFSYTDPETLIGSQQQAFGFVIDHESGAEIQDLLIKKQKNPNKYPPIIIANNYYSNRLYDEALSLYKNIRKNYPQSEMSVSSLYLKGRCLSKLASHKEATVAYQQFIQLYPNDPLVEHAKTHYIISLAESGKWALCQDAFARYIESITHTGLQLQLVLPLKTLLDAQPLTVNNTTRAAFKQTITAHLP